MAERQERQLARDGSAIEKRDREKRYLVSRSEERKLEDLALDLSGEVGASVKLSNLMRSLAQVAIAHRERIVSEARRQRALVRPPNADLEAVARFEEAIAEVIVRAVRG